jgi:small conductance mechanosensitive channel
MFLEFLFIKIESMHFDIEKFYNTAYNWILNVGPRLIGAIIFFVLAQWVIKIIKRWMDKALFKKNLHNSFKPFLISLAATILQVLTVLVLLQILNLQLTIFAAIVGGISVAAGFSLIRHFAKFCKWGIDIIT